MTEQPTNLVFLRPTPAPAVWKVTVIDGFELRPAGDRRIPNAFHRLMQRLVFGFRWERI